MVGNIELISTRLKLPGSAVIDRSDQNKWQLEVDCCILFHMHWAVRIVYKRLVVPSSDTDNVILFMHYIGRFKEGGLQELEFSLNW